MVCTFYSLLNPSITLFQLCGNCAHGGEEVVCKEWISCDVEILKISTKTFRFGKGSTVTVKTPTERVFCGTVFDSIGDLFTKSKSLAKGDSVHIEL